MKIYDTSGRVLLSSTTTPLDHTHASSGVQGGQLTSPWINEEVAMSATSTDLNLVDNDNFLFTLFTRGFLQLIDISYWAKTLVGGDYSAINPTRLQAGVNTTANSSVIYTAGSSFLNEDGATFVSVDWSKELIIQFWISRIGSDAESKAYIQLEGTNAIGQLTTKGVGIYIDNLTLYSESYGVARGASSLSTTMSVNYLYKIRIHHQPSIPQIDWYVNDVLKYSETTSNNIPQTAAAVSHYWKHSVANGATGGVNVVSSIAMLMCWRDR